VREKLRKDGKNIAEKAIQGVLPESGVTRGLKDLEAEGDIYVVSVGKAAWRMAKAASEKLGERIHNGIVLTKYGHSMGPIKGFEILEAGHPLPDENSEKGTLRIAEMVSSLERDDTVLFLLSGGGSALFEKPAPGISLADITGITDELLACGADIVEINTVRKRLSSVKAGRFAKMVEPASVYAIVLSDVLGDRLDSIASGPASADMTTAEDAFGILEKYDLQVSGRIRQALSVETPKKLHNVKTVITGSVRSLCEEAQVVALSLGYHAAVFATTLDCEAREAGRFISSLAREEVENRRPLDLPCALIMGGETVVHLKGNGKGGRNQETALSAAMGIRGLEEAVIVSAGSDGTDGPTDAAGGIVDGASADRMEKRGLSPLESLERNDSHNALKASGDLFITGPTGTNVNDLIVVLCDGR